MTGRKKDPIWCNFIEIKEHNRYVKARCKKCDINMVGLVARMKTHVKKCNSTLVNVDEYSTSDSSSIRSRSPSCITTDTVTHTLPSTSKSTISTLTQSKLRSMDMEPFIVRTLIANKKKFGIQIAKFIYVTNSAFIHVEHPEFIKLINLLHPGYKARLRRQIANELLNEVFDSELVKIKDSLNGRSVCMAQDGWSNIHNDSIVRQISLMKLCIYTILLIPKIIAIPRSTC